MRLRAVAVLVFGAIFVAHTSLLSPSTFSPSAFSDLLNISEAAAAGPATGGSLTVLALESKSVRRSSTKAKSEKTSSVARVSKKTSKAARVSAVKRAKLTQAGSQAVARRSTAKVIRVKGKSRSNNSAKLTRVSLDDALQSPSAEELAKESIAGTRFIRQRSGEPVQLTLGADGLPSGISLKNLIDNVDAAGHVRDINGNTISLTIDPALQQTAESLLMRYGTPWGAIVAVDPRTGALKAAASYSTMEPNGVETATRGGFPAASLFKMITSLSVAGITPWDTAIISQMPEKTAVLCLSPRPWVAPATPFSLESLSTTSPLVCSANTPKSLDSTKRSLLTFLWPAAFLPLHQTIMSLRGQLPVSAMLPLLLFMPLRSWEQSQTVV